MTFVYDPWMIRDRTFDEVCRFASEKGYDAIELSPRDDFIPLFEPPPATGDQIAELKRSLRSHEVDLVSLWTVYRWAEPDDPEACGAAVERFRRFIEIAVELECPHISSEFSGQPEDPEGSEAAFRRSMDKVLPVVEREGVTLAIDPHPGDFLEDGYRAMDLIRDVGSDHLKFLYSAPHTFFMDDKSDMAALIRYVAADTTFVRCADTLNHRVPLRFIVNPLGAPVVVHQHLNIGEGELDWDVFFRTFSEVGYNGPFSNSVFAWTDKVDESAERMLDLMKAHSARHSK